MKLEMMYVEKGDGGTKIPYHLIELGKYALSV